MAEFSIKQNDTRPKLVATLADKFGEPGQEAIDLTNATKIKLIMRERGLKDPTAPKVKADCEITDAKNGVVTYTWEAEDTDTTGIFDLEFEITWEDGGVETIPNNDYATVNVVDDLG